jgi:predicted methyltransferase
METVGPRRYRDVVYAEFEQVVELDGRLFHDSADARDADLDRDLDAAVERLGTVRLGWG